MDRFAAMIILLGLLVSAFLIVLALFAVAPITCSCLVSLFYSLYLFIAYEESGVHHAQEFENRFWTIFGLLLSTALFFATDSPVAFGLWSPTLGFIGVLVSGYAVHVWDRYSHRMEISRQTSLRRTSTANSSLIRLRDLGIPVEEQLKKINECLQEIDQLLIPSTINNFINQRFVLQKEREIISIFEECDARAINYLIGHVKLGLLFYKVKDHRSFNGLHRTELINLLAVDRLPILTVISRVIILHSLQLLKLRANPRAEYWVRNIILNTHQDELSELKTLTDAKGDYFSMNKLIFDDIRSESIRQDILNHIRREAAKQHAHLLMDSRRRSSRQPISMIQYRKVLSDVDDTLYCSGGMYPAGVDKRYPKKAVYPAVLAFYRELDLGTRGPDEWQDGRVGNLVFLSARPHLYKDISEKANFAKFEKLRSRKDDGRQGLHTMPSLLAGDLTSGGQYIYSNDFEPLAKKKFDNFRRYVSIFPEFQHVFVCDNGQGDVRAAEMMFDAFPYEFEALFVHQVQDITRTHGYAPVRWREKEFRPFFFRTYPEAALQAVTRNPPLIRIKGLQRICSEAVKDFAQITQWPNETMKSLRREELNQALWVANNFLSWHGEQEVELIQSERRFNDGQKVRTPYGIGTITGFNPTFDLYELELDWRPLDVQLAEHLEEVKIATVRPSKATSSSQPPLTPLATVVESDETEDDPSTTRNQEAASTVLQPPVHRVETIEDSASRQEGGQSSAEDAPLASRSAWPAPIDTGDSPPSLSSSEASLVSLAESGSSPSARLNVTSLKDSKKVGDQFRVFASVSGRFITKYTPPILPKAITEKPRGPIFPFLQKAPETPKQVNFTEGAECTTPFGPAKVIEYREKQGFVVVDMIGWHATGFFRKDLVKPASKSLISSFIRQLSMTEKPLEFPHAKGTSINTPFGKGKVTRPIPVSRPRSSRPPTLGVELVSWALANGKHPILYCTADAARAWKDRKEDGSSLFSALGTLVHSSRTLLEPFLSQKQTLSEPPKLFTRYYQDAASVSTSFGYGVVRSFRPSDGVYEISLTSWTLANGKHPVAFMRKEDISHRVAKGCQEGYPVLTYLGLSGTLASVEPTTGVHIVTIPSAGMVCYLQPECVVRPLKAAVGEDVLTAYGEGTVDRYDKDRDMYAIALKGWKAKLYAKGDTFTRVGEGIQDADHQFGVNWLLQLLFFSSQGPRSRSNSVVSVHGSVSSRSVTSR